jgi:hypothetical protein
VAVPETLVRSYPLFNVQNVAVLTTNEAANSPDKWKAPGTRPLRCYEAIYRETTFRIKALKLRLDGSSNADMVAVEARVNAIGTFCWTSQLPRSRH